MGTQEEIKKRHEEILQRLLCGELLAPSKLADEYGVSPKTIQRDFTNHIVKNNLQFDIRYEPELKVWKANDRTRDKRFLTNEETLIISMFREIISKHGSTFNQQAEWFFRRYEDNIINSIYSKVDCEDISGQIADLMLIQQAIEHSSALSINYREKGTRTICPYKIATFDGYWYIMARDTKDNKIKSFYFKEMADIELTTEHFMKEEGTLNRIDNAVNAYFDYHAEPFEVQLEVSPQVAHILKRKKINPTQYVINEYDDGTIEVSLTITYPMEIIPFIQSWMPHIRVISPQVLQDQLEQNLKVYMQAMCP